MIAEDLFGLRQCRERLIEPIQLLKRHGQVEVNDGVIMRENDVAAEDLFSE